MVDPNKPIVDTRTTVTGEGQAPAGTPVQQNSGSTPPANTPPAIQPGGTQSSTTVKTSTISSVPITSEVPPDFSSSSYAELYPKLKDYFDAHRPLSKEELDKLRRKQKIEGIISGISDAAQSVANLFYTTKYAPNMYNAKEGMSAKAKARFEKELADRKAEDDDWFNKVMMWGKLKDADKARGLEVWKTEQTLARQDRAYEDGRKDRAEDKTFRDKDYDERLRQWQANFDRQGEWHQEEGQRWERQFQEGVRQFNVSSAQNAQRIRMEGQRLAKELQQGQMTFNLGSGHGNVTLTMDKLNAQTVSRIYHTLPESVIYVKVPIIDKEGNVSGYKKEPKIGEPIYQNGIPTGERKEPTIEAMLIAIGANVEKSPATQAAIRQVAGLENGRAGSAGTMPGVQ